MDHQLPSGLSDASDVAERFDPATMQGQIIEAEHLARYNWISPLAHRRRVLDAGCGTAYGSALLARAGALEVIGVDRASDVLDAARAELPAAVLLEAADVTTLPYEDGRFDLVVCFEVIEHLDDPGQALDEFRRVLGPGGLLAVSSPNRGACPDRNPHHVHEYVAAELEQELARRFAFVRLDRQHTWVASGVLDDEKFGMDGDGVLETDVCVRKLASFEPGADLYTLVALAGHSELPRPTATLELAAPVELRRFDALWQERSEVLERQAQLLSDQERAFADHTAYQSDLQGEIVQLRKELARAETELARMPALDAQVQELIEVNDALLQLNNDLAKRQLEFDELVAMADRYTVVVESTSWKLTRPLRRIAALGRTLRTRA
jgi:2-polyprenyl-3-methyl-5-hydroxy-6-metoxy-1,4-benzoquinol methylase